MAMVYHFIFANFANCLFPRFVPHDPAGLISLFKSEEYFIEQLSEFFSRSKLDPSNDLPNPYYWAGNEVHHFVIPGVLSPNFFPFLCFTTKPDIFAPYLGFFANRPDMTQEFVRWVMDNKY